MSDRIEQIKVTILDEYTRIHWPPLRLEALDHTLGVFHAALLLARKRGVDAELAAAAALLHDYAKFALNQSGQHAQKGAVAARRILEESQAFESDQIEQICRAIGRHSDKDRIDDPLDEVLKDADVLARAMEQPIHWLDIPRRKRMLQIEKELCLLPGK